MYAGIVGDNVSYNRAAMAHIEKEYPRLITGGCAVHFLDLMIEDLAKLPEINTIISIARKLILFVKSHRRVHRAFKNRVGTSGRLLKLFPATRFGYCALMLQRVIENRRALDNIISNYSDPDPWFDVCEGIDADEVEKFERNIRNFELWKMLTCSYDLLSPVSAAIHHIESNSSVSSWIYLLVTSILKDTKQWLSLIHI